MFATKSGKNMKNLSTIKKKKSIRKVTMKDITCEVVNDDIAMPIAIYEAAISSTPRYCATICPVSGLPRIVIVAGYISVKISIITVKKKEDKNFPKTSCQSVKGRVKSNSIVPCFFSSVKFPIVIAGMKKRKRKGISSITVLKLANPAKKRLETKNQPEIIRKTIPTIYADNESK